MAHNCTQEQCNPGGPDICLLFSTVTQLPTLPRDTISRMRREWDQALWSRHLGANIPDCPTKWTWYIETDRPT